MCGDSYNLQCATTMYLTNMQFAGTVCIGLALYWHCIHWSNLQGVNSVCSGLTCIAVYVLFSIVCQYCMYWADLQCANSVCI